jgi:hypothetical protein
MDDGGEVEAQLLLSESITDKTTAAELAQLVKPFLSTKSQEILGDKAAEIVAKAFIFSSVITPTAPFDMDMLSDVIGLVRGDMRLTEEEEKEIVEIGMQAGIYKPSDKYPGFIEIKSPNVYKRLNELLKGK